MALYGKWRDKYTMEKARGFYFGSHMLEVLSACDLLFRLPMVCEGDVSFGERLFNVMDLGRFEVSQKKVTLEDFKNWSWLACLAHDLGKCSGEFQKMMWDKEEHFNKLGGEAVFKSLPEINRNAVSDKNTIRDKVSFRAAVKAYRPHIQSYRHEFLSGVLLLNHTDIHPWFLNEAGSKDGFNLVLVAAMGHHLKVSGKKAYKEREATQPIHLKLLSSMIGRFCKAPRASFPDLVDMTAEDLKVKDQPQCEETYDQILEEVDVRHDTPLSAALKWMVILSDSLGSIDKLKTKTALNGETDEQVRVFIRKFLTGLWEPVEVDYNERMVQVIFRTEQERLRKGTAARAETHDREGKDLSEEDKEELVMGSLRGFQRQALEARGKNLLATASTGGGKTISAMAWANPKRRLIFTTPTTDTATRLYLDYAHMKCLEDGSRQTEDAVKHSKEHLDFRKIATNTEEGSADEPSEEEDAFDAITTLQDFRKHGAQVTFTTADQVLGVLTFSRKSIMWLLQLVNSQIVFDEFHSYDPVLQAWHMRFLEWFPGIPSAHLSATVSNPLRQLLQKTGKEFHEISDEASEEASDARTALRYQIRVLKSREEAERYMGPGAIWFHNVVVRCQDTGRDFPKSLTYHSRFRFKDRRNIQTRMVDLFRADRHLNQGVACTQVAEMSLDVSADCAITEVCPPASLIQRMGRVNRKEIIPFQIALVYVYMPEMQSGMPYCRSKSNYRNEYSKWQKFASELEEKGPISKQDLDEAYQVFSNRIENISIPLEAFSSFVETRRKPLRSGSPIAACIMRADYKEGMKAADVQRVAVPVFLKEREGREKCHHHYIIDEKEGYYDPRLGFCVGAGAGYSAKEE